MVVMVNQGRSTIVVRGYGFAKIYFICNFCRPSPLSNLPRLPLWCGSWQSRFDYVVTLSI